jgi:threonine/homoserine/homoserine lactone efflux protein
MNDAGHPGPQPVFIAIALVSDSAWGIAAGTARSWLAGSPQRLARLGSIGGIAMIGLGVQLAITQHKD